MFMKLRFVLIGTAVTAAILSAQAPPADYPPPQGLAQPGPAPQGPANDPPARVARLNLINGQVSFQPAGLDAWTSATMNYPLTTGDHLYTDMGSRAELHIGPNAIRLNSETNFGFLNLD